MRRPACVFVAALALAPGPGRADPARLARALAPPVLPPLAPEAPRLEQAATAAFVRNPGALGGGRAGGGTSLALLHARFEAPLTRHGLAAGAALDAGAAATAGQGRSALAGGPELWLRAALPATEKLAAGGGLGLVLPLPRGDSGAAEAARAAARAVRPWDATRFGGPAFVLRPALDVGLIAGPLLLQLRQGLDLVFSTRDVREGEPSASLVARTGLYAGFQAGPAALGLELWEAYPVTADLPDEDRATFALSPALRLRFARVEPTLSLSLPLSNASYVSVTTGAAFRL